MHTVPTEEQPAETVLGRLAGACYDRRRTVLTLWILAIIGMTVLAQLAGTHFENRFTAGNTPSQQATNILQERFPSKSGDTADVVFHTTTPINSPANKAAIGQVVASVEGLPYVQSVTSPFSAAGAHQIADPSKGNIAFAQVQFATDTADIPTTAVKHVITTAQANAHDGFQVELGGSPISAAATAAPGPSEGIGITAAILIMLLAFGSVVAMGLPVITALAGLGIGVALLELLTHVLTVPNFSPEMAAMIGIGVGIDYALFIVTRYRQGIFEGRDPRNAVVTSLMTSGRSVLFAGSTVVISLFGLYLIGQAYMIGLATACIAAVLMVLIAALTLLPAMLGFAGNAIDKLHVPRLLQTGGPPPPDGFWYRWSRFVQRRAWVTGTIAVLVLIGLALPLFSMRLAFTDAGNDPASLTTRQAYDLLAQGFGPGFNGPLVIAADLQGSAADKAADTATVDTLQQRIAAHHDGIAFVAPPEFNAAHTGAVIVVYPTTSPQSSQTEALVQTLRNDVIPPAVAGTHVDAQVGGQTAASIDAANFLGHRLFIVIGAVLILSFLLLMVVFRSLVLPLKAVIMNLLSVGAAYGVMVAVFQWGWGGSVIGIGETGPIDPWIPVALFVILFGLSMDYEVFLLSRIREEWLRTHDNSLAVADGLAVTGRIITAAAAIMFCVFASFVIKDPLHILKVFGLGLATAVLVDATIVRMMLVPSIMELLGPVNWWMPAWMDRRIPQIGVEVTPDAIPIPTPRLPVPSSTPSPVPA
ncbi:MAG TPA: MMPL family transporter [Acidimicrobiales bacterium]|nr:MMPL family transporter [Acidimicrobiales bacterium]